MIKAAAGLIFKHWDLILTLCSNRASYQAVIKTANTLKSEGREAGQGSFRERDVRVTLWMLKQIEQTDFHLYLKK